MKLELLYPIRPFHLNQGFGANPAYYARFHDTLGNPEKGHMGLDLMANHGQTVYAAHDGLARYVKDEHGGEGIYIRSTAPAEFAWSTSYFETIYWHLCSKDDPAYNPFIPTDGKEYPVKAGDLIGYADNSGAPFESSGDHLHFGLVPVDANGNILHPGNGFGGCVDPAPYFNGKYADEIHIPASQFIAVEAAKEQAEGKTDQSNTLWAIVKWLQSLGK